MRLKRKPRAVSEFAVKDFAAGDRVIWRNSDNRLRHGIVEQLGESCLMVVESFPNVPRANPGAFDINAEKKREDAIEVSFENIVRIQNL